jgi:hypothetical protein
MSLTLTVTDHWTDGKRIHVVFNLTPTGNYVALGDTINFGVSQIKSQSAPEFMVIQGQLLNTYLPVFGTNISTGNKMKIIIAGAELAAGAYPAGVTNDVIKGYAIFPKFI